MSFDTCFQESTHNIAETFAIDAPGPGIPAMTAGTVASANHRRESTRSRADQGQDAAGRWNACCERQGVVEIHDPRLLGSGHAAFCRALVEAAVARFGAIRAEVRMESSTCRLEFGPGRFDRTELAGRVAAAVRAATSAVRDGATSSRATRGTSSDVRTSAKRSVAARTGSRRLADLAKAAASLALAVGGAVLPGIPTLPFLILSGRYAIRVSPGIERLLMSRPWCAALLTEAENPSGPTLDWRSLGKTIGLVVLFTAASVILHPPLPVVLVVELGTIVFLGWRELDRSAGRKPVRIVA
jgi:uncharacterized membrane protein YbaN (DUF454 family)